MLNAHPIANHAQCQPYAYPVRFAAYPASHAYSAGHVAYSARFLHHILLLLLQSCLFCFLFSWALSLLLTLQSSHSQSCWSCIIHVLLMFYAKPISFAACPGPACLSCSLRNYQQLTVFFTSFRLSARPGLSCSISCLSATYPEGTATYPEGTTTKRSKAQRKRHLT
jgi:hypothetical protein